MAQVKYKGRHNCGGSLIAPTWVLTAAHCTYDVETKIKEDDVSVVLGRQRLNGTDGESYKVVRIVRAGYRPGDFRDDVALLQLDRPSSVPPVTLAGPTDTSLWQAGDIAFALGWGRTGSDKPSSNELLIGGLRIGSEPQCDKAWKKQPVRFFPAVEICTGTDRKRTDICKGDSGGPLFVRRADGTPALIGLTSFNGKPCGRAKLPSAFAEVGDGRLRTFVLQKAGLITAVNEWAVSAVGIGPVLRLGMNEQQVRAAGLKLAVDRSGPFCDTWKVDGLNGVAMFATRDGGGLRSIQLLEGSSGHGASGVERGDSLKKLKAKLGSRLEFVKASPGLDYAFYRIYSPDRTTALQFGINTDDDKVVFEEVGFPGEFYFPDGTELCA